MTLDEGAAMATELPDHGAVLAGGPGGGQAFGLSVSGSPAAAGLRGVAAGSATRRWPGWAVPQLEVAAALADCTQDGISIAALLYRSWFSPVVAELSVELASTPLVGLYRYAHAGSARRIRTDDLAVVACNDVVRPNGWWRTWGADWMPPRDRRGLIRLLFSPRPEALAEFVSTLTGRMLRTDLPWALSAPTVARRLTRCGAAMLDIAGLKAVPRDLLDELRPLLLPTAPPLCLPLDVGVGAAEYPDNGMTFGEHRCHLVAMGLRNAGRHREPLDAVADVFTAHGINPSAPHRAG